MSEYVKALHTMFDFEQAVRESENENSDISVLSALYGHVMLVDALTDSSLVTGKALASHQGYVLAQQIAAKQNTLTFDTAPTSGSTNPVTSGGVYTADQTLQTNIANEATARANADTNLQSNINTRQPTVIFVTVTVPTASWSSGTQTVTVTLVLPEVGAVSKLSVACLPASAV